MDRITPLLRAALALLRENGWCQGRSQNEAGQFCSNGAIMEANKREGGYYDGVGALHRMNEVLGLSGIDGDSLVGWNDTPGRTWAEVEDAFVRAIGE